MNFLFFFFFFVETTTLKQANSTERSSEAKGLGIIDSNAIDKEVSTAKKSDLRIRNGHHSPQPKNF